MCLIAENTSYEMSGLFWGYLGKTLGLLGSILDHLGASRENLVTTWVQGHVLEMPKSLSLGICAAKTLA